jgi:hypothetical protein
MCVVALLLLSSQRWQLRAMASGGVDGLSWYDSSSSTSVIARPDLRQICAAIQLLYCLPFILARIVRRFVEPITTYLRTARSNAAADSDVEELVIQSIP